LPVHLRTGSPGTIIITDDLLANFQLAAPFAGSLHCRYPIMVRVYQLAMNSDEGKICFVKKTQTALRNRSTDFQTALLWAHQLIPRIEPA